MSSSGVIATLRQMLNVRPLAARLLAYVLLFSLLVAVMASGAQLAGEYRQRLADIRVLQQKTAEIIEDNLSQQLWLMNFREVETMLDELLAFDVIQHAEVTTPEGPRFSIGQYPAGKVIKHRTALTVEQAKVLDSPVVGHLTLTSSTDQIRSAILARAAKVLLFQLLFILVGTLGLLVIVRLMLSRHLETIADYATRLSLNAVTEPLQLQRKSHSRSDELGEIELALNQMRQRLLDETRDLRQSSLQSLDERDRAIQANHAKNLFLANLSHELRIPLQSVLGYASLLQDTQMDQEQRDYLDTLLHAAEGLSAIINDLLDIASIETGKLELDSIEFNLRDIFNDLVTMLEPQARQKGLALELRIDENLPSRLLGDPIRIRQILLNLAANAIRHTSSGHVLVSTELLGRQGDLAQIRLSVEDTGDGIAEQNLGLIFEPYVQIEAQPTRRVSGVGLGLTISRHLARLMNGDIRVESSPGHGTTFWVELKLAQPSQHHAPTRQRLTQVRGRRILVVDSYALSRKITLEILSRLDVDIEAVTSGAEALSAQAIASEAGAAFDGVIVDSFTPDMDSDRLCRRIRENPNWQDIRILILATSAQRGDSEHFRHAGADAFLNKALRESRLPPLLNQLFEDLERGQRHFLTRFSLQPSVVSLVPPAPPSCGPLVALLAEDNPVNRALTKRLLEKLNCQVTVAGDGEQALDLWRHGQFDLIFMDCVMPGLDGYEATQCIRQEERERQLEHTPVIALTASAMEEDEERCRQAGMDLFVAKPVSIDMLRAVLEQYCSSQSPQALSSMPPG